jgi:hypothetical protein
MFAPAHITVVSPWKAGPGGVTPWLDCEGQEGAKNPTSHLQHLEPDIASGLRLPCPGSKAPSPPLAVFNLEGPKVRMFFWKVHGCLVPHSISP